MSIFLVMLTVIFFFDKRKLSTPFILVIELNAQTYMLPLQMFVPDGIHFF